MFELVRKDLMIFASDRKSMLISFLVPICIASFIGSIMGNIAGGGPQAVGLLVVNEDDSPVTERIVQRLKSSKTLEVSLADQATARARVRGGEVGTAVIFPKGFAARASAAMMGGTKPDLLVLTDPSKGIESKVAEGTLLQSAVEPIAEAALGTPASLPFTLVETPQTRQQAPIPWSGSAHAFAGLAVQALFFGALETAMSIMKDRRLGIWPRLRASPVSRWALLIARLLGSAIIALMVFLGVVAAGALLFHYRITGSYLGFAMVAVATTVMTASVGLFIAALGRTEQQSRGLSILVILVMLMLGGAWIPLFFFPKWVQNVSYISPVRWAVDGIDFMTWRGGGLVDAARCSGVLLLFAVVLGLVAGKSFRWSADES
jgi:ABC-2 type transport system permease protein